MNTGYREIYTAYLRSRERKTVKDIEILEGVAHILSMEGLTLMKLRARANLI